MDEHQQEVWSGVLLAVLVVGLLLGGLLVLRLTGN
jgi:high-affinity Fe2+/Pb2+ permease